MHYQFKQDLAMAYFDGCSKKTASRLLAREINLTPGLLDALRPTGYRPAQKRISPANSKSSSPSSANPKVISPKH